MQDRIWAEQGEKNFGNYCPPFYTTKWLYRAVQSIEATANNTLVEGFLLSISVEQGKLWFSAFIRVKWTPSKYSKVCSDSFVTSDCCYFDSLEPFQR